MSGTTFDGTQATPRTRSQRGQTTASSCQPRGARPCARKFFKPTLSTNFMQKGHFAISTCSISIAPGNRAALVVV
jgi:hypothetical protein